MDPNLLFDLANEMTLNQVDRQKESGMSSKDFARIPIERQTERTIIALRTAGHELLTLQNLND